ncbi:hypothetical protein [Anabaena azotica]|uniref:Uncharacterized protein n=1 Tax=Anabaena azotica FACHB-119 TaxID=947527 RepID=A0ABR8DEG7_9NOST|nr:hypothetical protein [Anabaena azotica]MBD2504898.1 hypothetical protein [Anabaena azotica FACHB-119]
MINPTIEFVLQNGNNHFYLEGEEKPVVDVDEASRYSTFNEASSHIKTFHQQNDAVEVFVRPVQLSIELLD